MQMLQVQVRRGGCHLRSELTCVDASTRRCVSWPLSPPAASSQQCDTTPKHVYILSYISPLFHNVRTYACAQNTARYTVQFSLPARSRDSCGNLGAPRRTYMIHNTGKKEPYFNSNIYDALAPTRLLSTSLPPPLPPPPRRLPAFLSCSQQFQKRGRERKKKSRRRKMSLQLLQAPSFPSTNRPSRIKNTAWPCFFPAAGAAAPLRAFPDAAAFE